LVRLLILSEQNLVRKEQARYFVKGDNHAT
jgi:hypothetical protein